MDMFDCLSYQWSSVNHKGAIPSPRWGHTCEVIDKRLYLVGGTNTKKLVQCADLLYRMDIDFSEWSPVEARAGIPP